MAAGRGNMSDVNSDFMILNNRLMSYINVSMDNTVDVSENIAEYCRDDVHLDQATRDIMQKFIEMENDIQQVVKALNYVKSVGMDSGQSLSTLFKDKLQEIQAGEKPDYKQHPKYLELEEKLKSKEDFEEQLNSLRATLAGNTNDEEFAMTAEVNIKCPFTGQVMVNPVRNKICNHVYDREGILSHINSRKHKARCPVGGCENKDPVTPDNLEDHKDLKKYITLLSKRTH